MELITIILFFIFIFVFVFVLLGNKSSLEPGTHKLPPGPRTLPVIGSIHHLLFRRSPPHRVLRDLACAHGPVLYLHLGHVPAVVVSSPAAAAEVLKAHDAVFASRPETTATSVMTYGRRDLIFAAYGEHWRQLRKLCVLELFSARRVNSFRSIREEEVACLVRSLSSSSLSPVNVSETLTELTNNITARSVLGGRCSEQKRYLEVLNEARMLLSGFLLVDLFPGSKIARFITGAARKIDRCHRKMDGILDAIVEDRRDRRMRGNVEPAEQDSLLDVLLSHQEKGDELGFAITKDIVKAVIFDVFAAGTGTSSSTMGWAMSELIKSPKAMQRAREEARRVVSGKDQLSEEDIQKLRYLKLVIKETLRLHPPAPLLLPRESRETCEIHGYDVPANTRVLVNAWAMGRDPEYWNDPEDFKPERFDGGQIDFKGGSFQYIPFGAGRRICPGMLFGLSTMEVTLARLLGGFDWKLPDGMRPEDLDMDESFGSSVRRRSDLYLCAVPRA